MFYGAGAEIFMCHFDLYFQRIQIVDSVNNQQIMGRGFAHTEENTFDLRRKYVDATNNEHIVASAVGLGHADECTAAGTGSVVQASNIPGAVTDQGKGFLCHTGEDQFAVFTGRQGHAGFGIDDFGNEVIFVHMQSVLICTVKGNAGTGDFSQTVYIKGF